MSKEQQPQPDVSHKLADLLTAKKFQGVVVRETTEGVEVSFFVPDDDTDAAKRLNLVDDFCRENDLSYFMVGLLVYDFERHEEVGDTVTVILYTDSAEKCATAGCRRIGYHWHNND